MNGRVAAMLGVGPGLGAAVARRFAGEGFAVAMMARQEESLAEIRQEIEDDGGKVLTVSVDATDADSVAAAFERARDELGDPEVLVYNAGAFQMGGVLEVSPVRFDECFRANCAVTLSTTTHSCTGTGHLDRKTTVGSAGAASTLPPAANQGNLNSRAEWGQKIQESPNGQLALYERDFDHGKRVFTFVIWA